MRTDVHTHLVPPVPTAALAAVGLDRRDGRLVAGDRVIGPPDLYRPESLVAWLGEVGLDRALVSVPPPLYRQQEDVEVAARWARDVNDALALMTEPFEALEPLGHLPLESPEAAIAEAGRLVAAGWVGFAACAGARSCSLASPDLEPLWETLVEADKPLLLHPGPSPDARLGDFYLENLLGNPVETGLAAGQLLLGGVLDRHPDLRVALVHCGGVVPAVLGRWQRGVDTTRPGVDRTDADLRAEARRLWVDGLAHDPAVVDLAAAMVGDDHLLVGSDWPFPMGTRDPVALLAHRGADVAERASVRNARVFLGETPAAVAAP